MTLKDELTARVTEFARDDWGHIPNARVPPDADDLTFGNDGERLDVCVLYADIHRSTEMVDALPDTLAASYYKAFLYCAAKLIRRNGGVITAYDGDRVMAVFVGESKAEDAVSTAFELNYAVENIVNPMFRAAHGLAHREIIQTVGIDQGVVLAAKTGVRVDSDLVWVGPAANYAAKLNSFEGLEIEYRTRITSDVRVALPEYLKVHDGQQVWGGPFNNLKKKLHYRSNFSKIIP